MEYGLIGEKLGHSFSKEIHERISSYQYEIYEVSKNDFDKFMNEKNFKAINVTIPYKEKVIPYLSYIDDIAKEIGAVNTIVNHNGKLYGYNTDYYGLKSLIEKNGIDLNNKKVLILGTGGTSKTATAVAKSMGAKNIIYASLNDKPNTISYDDAIKYHLDIEVIINTTPCGMYPNNDDLIIDISGFKELTSVCDVIYNPLQTSLLQHAKNQHLKCASGLYMLVAQAVYASSIFKNEPVSLKLIDEVFDEIYKTKENIILIGMPTCGKTTIGQILAKDLNKKFIDVDELIEEELKMPIKDFLNHKNENEFRNIEERVIAKISKLQNLVISTGGGVVKRNINIKRLKQNGKVIFINRDLNLLTPMANRPLSNNINDLKKLYDERYHLYLNAADIIVKNNTSIDEVITKIKKEV